VRVQRRSKERSSPERISKLERLPGWTWDSRETAWEKGFAALEKFVGREGNARVPHSYLEDGFRLGQWVGSQRSRKERSLPERISRLERLPGWTWDTKEADWEEGFAALEKFIGREGNARVPKSYLEDAYRLGGWVQTQRSRKERSSPERISKLESLPGWTWDLLESAWEERFAALEKYVGREGHARVPKSYLEDGFRLGQWVGIQRRSKERSSPKRISRLEGLPGWVWDTNEAGWEEGFATLEKYVRREGHAHVPSSYREDGYRLGQWVVSCRGRKEGLSSEQIFRLESLPGWTWNTKETAWEEGFAALEKYVGREGHARVPSSYREDAYRLGQWVSVQRSRKEGLSPERISKLDSLSGWVWKIR